MLGIEAALAGAGVEFEDDAERDTVTLRRIDRPSAYETLFASQRVLELLSPDSLTPVEKVLFFVRREEDGETEAAARICLLIEGHNRAILLDQVQFSVANSGRAAEVAAILLWAFKFHANALFYLDQVLDDTTAGESPEVVRRLRALPWRELRHPSDFFEVFDDWEGHLRPYAEREGHPMAELLAVVSAVRQA